MNYLLLHPRMDLHDQWDTHLSWSVHRGQLEASTTFLSAPDPSPCTPSVLFSTWAFLAMRWFGMSLLGD
jgi:hypothetical protein